MIDHTRKIIDIAIPRTGSSARRRAYVNQPGEVAPKLSTLDLVTQQEQHWGLAQYEFYYPEEYRTYTKVSCVRHPAEQLVSAHRMMQRRLGFSGDETFNEQILKQQLESEYVNFIRRDMSRYLAPLRGREEEFGRGGVDVLLRYETLSTDWRKFAMTVNERIPEGFFLETELKFENADPHPVHYGDLLSPQMAAHVISERLGDFLWFGYRYQSLGKKNEILKCLEERIEERELRKIGKLIDE